MTLDHDVARAIERLRKRRRVGLKELVNEALRRGLQHMEDPPPRANFRTKTVTLGSRVSNVDDIAELLAAAEGDEFG